ncbi:MAG: sugar ABC transporter permease [Anaerolineae bacterium]|nr:sugar ABC transporter permease [Anaerolineae bacterium]
MQSTFQLEKKANGTKRLRGQPSTIILFLLPAAILFLTFVIFPIIQGAYISLYKWNGLGPLENFVGFDNFATMFEHEPFHQALIHNLVIIVLSIGLQLPIALGLALLVGRKLPGRTFFRTLFFLPYVISEAISAILWSFIFNPRFAASEIINAVLDTILPFFDPGPWLGDPQKVLSAIFIVLTWKYFGLHMILYIAGLQGIPTEIEEAASIDGANQWQTLRFVTIPMLSRTIYTTIYLSVLGSLQQFDLVWLMTEGGPVGASEVLTTYMYRHGFVSFKLGYGAGVAVVLFSICLVFSLIYQYLFMREDYAGAVE